MEKLPIKEDDNNSEAGSSDAATPPKIIKTDDSSEVRWAQVKGKTLVIPKEKQGPPKIIESIDQTL